MPILRKTSRNASQQESVTIIAQSCKLEGSFETPGKLIVDGSLTGDLKCNTLEVGKNARINANIEADNIDVGGSLKGEIFCNGRLFIANTGEVKGRISYGSLLIETGGLLEGYIKRKLESEETKLLPHRQVDRF